MLDTGAINDTRACTRPSAAGGRIRRLAAAVFSHHHVDHIFGVAPFEEEADEKRWPRPLVYGHARPRRRTSTATRRRWAGTAPSTSASSPSRSSAFAGPPSTATRTWRTSDRMTFRGGGLTLRAAPRARRDGRRDVDVDPGAEDLSRPATCSSGRRRTPATRRRCSAMRRVGGGAARDGRPRRGDDAARPRHADLRRGPHRAGAHRHRRPAGVARVAGAGADEHRARRSTACCTKCEMPERLLRQALPAADLRPPAVHPAEHLAAVRRLVRRRARQPAAGAARRAGARVGRPGRRLDAVLERAPKLRARGQPAARRATSSSSR